MRALLVAMLLFMSGCSSLPEAPDTEPGLDSGGLTSDPCAVVSALDDPCIAGGLRLGQALFLERGAIEHATVSGYAGRCAGECIALRVPVAATTGQLHLGVEAFLADPDAMRATADAFHMGPETKISIQITTPSGQTVDTLDTQGAFADVWGGPAEAGDWSLRIQGKLQLDDVHYRIRAAVVEPRADDGRQLPDLRIIPPFEVGFAAAAGTILPGVPVPAYAPALSCMPEEQLEAVQEGLPSPTVCLRFSMGIENMGPGPLILREDGGRTPQQSLGLQPIPLIQVVCNVEATNCTDLESVPGLEGNWHQTHIHRHYQNAYVYDLYRYDPGTGAMEFVQTSGKLGLDPTNEALADWEDVMVATRNMPAGIYETGERVGTAVRITAGWGDIYDWNRSGNYIDFPLVGGVPEAGEFVIIGTTDPEGHIVETDESNNVAYTHIAVSLVGGVTVLERGIGLGPDDPDKAIIEHIP